MPSPQFLSPRRLRRPFGVAVAAVALALTGTLLAAPQAAPPAAAASNPITPGNFTGKGFDQCNTVRQYKMDAWLKHSPYRAVGVYISGASRFCREQPNLTPKWVRNQLTRGWKILPITLGPQASCLNRFPRYGADIDPTINPSRTDGFAAAKKQAVREANIAVAEAKRLGIVPGSTLYYDLEGFDINHSINCRNSAVWFLSSWTLRLHRLGYASGVYSSAGSGIVLLERARVSQPAGYHDPDQIWIARWDGKANTSTTYIPDTGWQNQRIKQYLGGHNETYGGVTINIDSNYLDVRTPKLPGQLPSYPPATTGTYDPSCTGASISKPAYRLTTATRNAHLITPLQCLLKQQGHYNREVTGKWNYYTTTGLRAFQRKVDHPVRNFVSRSDWISMLSLGSNNSRLDLGARGADVIRMQRALNAATAARLEVNGYYTRKVKGAMRTYQERNLPFRHGVVEDLTWSALHRGLI